MATYNALVINCFHRKDNKGSVAKLLIYFNEKDNLQDVLVYSDNDYYANELKAGYIVKVEPRVQAAKIYWDVVSVESTKNPLNF